MSMDALEHATQERLRYERVMTDARHVRDAAIYQAWLAFEKTASGAWIRYQAAAQLIEEELRLKGL